MIFNEQITGSGPNGTSFIKIAICMFTNADPIGHECHLVNGNLKYNSQHQCGFKKSMYINLIMLDV